MYELMSESGKIEGYDTEVFESWECDMTIAVLGDTLCLKNARIEVDKVGKAFSSHIGRRRKEPSD